MRIAVVGTGAFGRKHLDALSRIENVEVIVVASRTIKQARVVATKYGVKIATDEFFGMLDMPTLDAVILCTPTQLHAEQAIAVLRAGKHVQVEIPLADNWSDVQEVAEVARDTQLRCMVGHTRRFNPSHQWIHQRVLRGELSLQHLDVQTFFFRRTNINALGQSRSWVDNLLWHHAAHAIDLFAYQSNEVIVDARVMAGPRHEKLQIPMDLSIQLQSESGKLCTVALSFNNDGPIGSFFRYICDNGTYLARYDDLVTGHNKTIDLSHVAITSDGIELQDREFISSIIENRAPNASLESVMNCYKILGQLQEQLGI